MGEMFVDDIAIRCTASYLPPRWDGAHVDKLADGLKGSDVLWAGSGGEVEI